MTTGHELDKKLFANRGAIGRKDYVINMSILFCVALFITIPCMFWFANSSYHIDFHYLRNLYYAAPFVFQALLMLALCTSVVIGISNIKRRMIDIFGRDVEVLKYIISTFYVLFLFSFFLPLNVALVTNGIFFVFALVLMLKKGKITPQLKESVVEIQIRQ